MTNTAQNPVGISGIIFKIKTTLSLSSSIKQFV